MDTATDPILRHGYRCRLGRLEDEHPWPIGLAIEAMDHPDIPSDDDGTVRLAVSGDDDPTPWQILARDEQRRRPATVRAARCRHAGSPVRRDMMHYHEHPDQHPTCPCCAGTGGHTVKLGALATAEMRSHMMAAGFHGARHLDREQITDQMPFLGIPCESCDGYGCIHPDGQQEWR